MKYILHYISKTYLLTSYNVSSQIDVRKHIQSKGRDKRSKSLSLSLNIYKRKSKPIITYTLRS